MMPFMWLRHMNNISPFLFYTNDAFYLTFIINILKCKNNKRQQNFICKKSMENYANLTI